MENEHLFSMSVEEFKALLKQAIKEVIKDSHDEPIDDEVMDIHEAARFLRFKVSTVHDKTFKREIPHFKTGKILLFKRSELRAWVESRRVATNDDLARDASRMYNRTPPNKRKKSNTNVR